jgi:hypothetical protein
MQPVPIHHANSRCSGGGSLVRYGSRRCNNENTAPKDDDGQAPQEDDGWSRFLGSRFAKKTPPADPRTRRGAEAPCRSVGAADGDQRSPQNHQPLGIRPPICTRQPRGERGAPLQRGQGPHLKARWGALSLCCQLWSLARIRRVCEAESDTAPGSTSSRASSPSSPVQSCATSVSSPNKNSKSASWPP